MPWTSAQVTMHRMDGEYAKWRGHVIVCGLHGVGLRIVDLLNLSGVPTVVVDDNPDLRLARSLIDWGIPHLAGRPQAAGTLAEAGLAGADAVICVLEDDLGTLGTALLTRELRTGIQEIWLAGERFATVQTTATRPGSLRELYGALAPVAVQPAGAEVAVCPGRDHEVAAGDQVTLFGTADELRAAGVTSHRDHLAGAGTASVLPQR